MKNKAEVTVYCLAYNHEKYIAKCLDSIVSQITSFSIQVVVHDDASRDGTRAIIEDYHRRFPNIIIPIFQSENQYSKGIKIYKKIIEPMIDTKYIAVCEGDDFWSDNDKLQIQYDYMEQHDECSLCVHNTERVSEDGIRKSVFFNSAKEDKEYGANDIIEAKGGGLFHTSSFFYRYNDRLNMPEDYILNGAGDYSLAIYLSIIGKVYYINKVMSCYREGSVNSWVQRQMKNTDKQVLFNLKLINYLKKIDEITKGKYHESFNKAISEYIYKNAILELDIRKIRSDERLNSIFRQKPLKYRIKIVLKSLLKKKK